MQNAWRFVDDEVLRERLKEAKGILKQADPALVDPGVTAQLECLLDEVVIGKQEMVGAIDAVCDVAQRIISKLKEGAAGGEPPVLSVAVNCDAGGASSSRKIPNFSIGCAYDARCVRYVV
jgi:DNA topoisomerase-3